MKKLLLLFVGISAFYSVRAQDIEDSGTPILFVNSDRTQILRVKADSGAPKVVIQSTAQIKMSHLAILASTRDGKSLLIAGIFHYNDIKDQQPDSMKCFLRVNAPFTFAGVNSIDDKQIGGNRVLYEIPFTLEEPGFLDERKPLPLGTLSPNEQDWYATWTKNGPIELVLYHGKFDGSGTVDIAKFEDSRKPQNEYHMSNLAVDDQGNMIAIVIDYLQSDNQQRASLHRWQPPSTYQSADMTGQFKGLTSDNIDLLFSCVLRIVPGEVNPTAEVGLMPSANGDIEFHSFRYNVSGSIGNLTSTRTIPRSVIEDSIMFFTGKGIDVPKFDNGVETLPVHARNVNGGDMMFSQTGDSVVFIVSNALTPNNAADWYASPERSGIWIYNIAEQWPKAKFVYNNPAKMERQPIFMGQIWKIKEPPPPPPQGSLIFSLDTLQFDSVDVGKTKAMTLNVTNPSTNTVNGISLGLPTDDAFIVTSSLPDSLKGGQTLPLTVTFAPSAVGPVVGSIKATFALSEDSSRTLYMRGVGRQPASVDPEDLSGFSVRVHPNPFSGAANIDINYDGREGLEVRLVDVLGREYRVDAEGVRAQMLTKDASEQFRLDSKALKLAPGTYTLFVKNGERSISRQLIVSE